MDSVCIQETDLRILHGLVDLEELDISYLPHLKEKAFKEFFETVKSSNKIKWLSVANSEIEKDAFLLIANKLPGLRYLNIGGNMSVDDDVIKVRQLILWPI